MVHMQYDSNGLSFWARQSLIKRKFMWKFLAVLWKEPSRTIAMALLFFFFFPVDLKWGIT